MKTAMNCILCGQATETEPGANWVMCWRCVLWFADASQEELRTLKDRLLARYERNHDPALLAFIKHAIDPCLVQQPDLKAIREKLGLSTREMGKKLGVSASAICQWEKKKRPLPVRFIRRLNKLAATL